MKPFKVHVSVFGGITSLPLAMALLGALMTSQVQGQQGDEQGSREAQDSPGLIYVAKSTPDDPLLGYSWDGLGEVPAQVPAADSTTLSVPFGEAGLSDEALVYLPFHPATAQSRSKALNGRAHVGYELQALIPADGLYGGGLSFPNPQAMGTLNSEKLELLGSTWSLEFWFRPSGEQAVGTLLEAPGVLRVILSKDGYARVILGPDKSMRLRSSTPVQLDRWNHIGVSLDGPELRQLRFALNGAAKGMFVGDIPHSRSILLGGFVGQMDELLVSSRPSTSAEFLATWERGITFGEHRLELRYGNHTRTVVPWSGILTSPLLGPDNWSRGRLEHAVVKDNALTWAPGHWSRYSSRLKPLPRTTHPTVYLGHNRVLIFGGETRDSHVGGMVNTNDTWIFQTDTGVWKPSQSALAPPPSCHQSAAFSPDHDVVLYAGGKFNQGDKLRTYDQTWLYHVDQDRWEQRHPGGHALRKTSDGAIVYLPKLQQFLLLSRSQMLLYDPDADRWTLLPASPASATDNDGNPVLYWPGSSPMAGYDPVREEVFFFGGSLFSTTRPSAPEWSNQTAYFDPESQRIRVLNCDPAPTARVRAGFAYDSIRNQFVMFGGVLDQMSQRKDDLWKFDSKQQRWTQLAASNSPAARGGFYNMAFDAELDLFILLCGRLEARIFSNEAWALDLNQSAIGSATYVFDRGTYAQLMHWFSDSLEPTGSALGLRFRGSADAIDWGVWTTSLEWLDAASSRFVQVEVSMSSGSAGSLPRLRSMGFCDENLQGLEGGSIWKRQIQRIGSRIKGD